LELLDEITKLAFESRLPKEINGHRHTTLTNLYRSWKGALYIPEKVHPAIKWSDKNQSTIKPEIADTPWHTIDRSKKADDQAQVQNSKAPAQFVPARGTLPVQFKESHLVNLKQKSEDAGDSLQYHSKKQKIKS